MLQEALSDKWLHVGAPHKMLRPEMQLQDAALRVQLAELLEAANRNKRLLGRNQVLHTPREG